jgi:hypothetical protein
MNFLKKSDVLIIIVLVVLSLVSMFLYRSIMSGKPAVAYIYFYGELIDVIKLEQGIEKSIRISEAPGVILQQDSDGSIRFESSNCPDKVCVDTGKLSMIGQNAACLPNGVLVKILPSGERDLGKPDIIIE